MMKKRLLAFVLAIVMLLSLSACGSKAEEIDLNTASWEEILEACDLPCRRHRRRMQHRLRRRPEHHPPAHVHHA